MAVSARTRANEPVNIEISGDELGTLKSISLLIQKMIKDTPGLVNMTDDFSANRSEFQVIIDREKTARLGLNTAQVASYLRTAVNGKTVSTYRINKEEYDIVVRLGEKYRRSLHGPSPVLWFRVSGYISRITPPGQARPIC